jgi:adenine-specific DNA methylase
VSSDTATDNQRSNHFFHDSTERPIQRPKDPQTQKACYSGKKKQRTIKNNLIINAASKVVLLTPSYEGSIHDKRIADTIGYLCAKWQCFVSRFRFSRFYPCWNKHRST